MNREVKDAVRLATNTLTKRRSYKNGGRWVGNEWIDEDGIIHKRETPSQDTGITTPRSKESKTTPKVLISPEEYRKGNIGPGAYSLRKGGRAKLADGGDPTKLMAGTTPTTPIAPTTTIPTTTTPATETPPLQSQISNSYQQYFGSPNQDYINYIANQVEQGAYTLPQVQQWMQSQAGQDWHKQITATPQASVTKPTTTAAPIAPATQAQAQVSEYGTQPQAQPSTNQQSAASNVSSYFKEFFGQELPQEQLNMVMNDINQGKYTSDQLASAWYNSIPAQQYYIQNYWKDLTGKDLSAEQNKTLADALNNKTYSTEAILDSMENSPDAVSYNNDQLLDDTFAGYGIDPTPEQKAQFLADLNSGKKNLDQVDTEIGNLPEAGMGETIEPYDVAGKGVSKKGIPNTPARMEKFLASIPAEVVEAGKTRLIKEMDEQGITYPPQARDVIASNVIGETGFGLAPEKSYSGTSNSRIKKLFSNARKLTDKELNELKKDDRSFFNKVYEDVNGNEGGDDGYNYRGRGAVQLTGKANYLKYGQLAGLGDQLVKNPDLVNDPDIGTKVAVTFMLDKLKHGKGRNAFDRITKGVNSHGPTVSKKRTIYKSLTKDSPFSIKLMPETGPTTPGSGGSSTTPEFKPPGPSSDAGTGASGTGVGGGSGSIGGGGAPSVGSIGGGSSGGPGGGTGGGGGGTAPGSADASSTGGTGVYLGPMVVNGNTVVGAQPGYTSTGAPPGYGYDTNGNLQNFADYSWTSSEYKNPWGAGWIDSIDNVKRGGRITGTKKALKLSKESSVKDALRLAKETLSGRRKYKSGGAAQDIDYDMSHWDEARRRKAIENRFAISPKTGASEATPKSEPSEVTPKISPEEYYKGKLGEGRFALASGGTGSVSYAPKAQNSTSNFVKTAYEEMTGRPVKDDELNAWVPYLDQGGTDKAGLMNWLAQTPEGANWANTKTLDQTFRNLTGEPPSQADQNLYLPQLAAGTLDYAGLRNAVSKDPLAQNYQNTQLLNDTSYALLGRAATPKEQNDYLSRLANGTLDSSKLFEEMSQRPDSLAYQKDEKAIAPKVSIAPPEASSYGYDKFKSYLGDALKSAGDDIYSKMDAINKAIQMPLSSGEQAGLDLISKLESGGNYNMILGDNINKDPASGKIAQSIGYAGNLDKMPLNELYKMQGDMLRSPANNKNSSAVGKLQFTRENLFGTEKAGFKDGQLYKFGITPDMWNKFSLTPALQDKLGAQMAIEKRGMDLTNPNTWGQNAKNEWASMWDTLRNKEGISAVKAAAEGPSSVVGGKTIAVPGGTTPTGGGTTTPDISKPIGPGSSLSIDQIYNQSYGRNATPGETAYLNDRIKQGSLTLDTLAAYLPTTQEAKDFAAKSAQASATIPGSSIPYMSYVNINGKPIKVIDDASYNNIAKQSGSVFAQDMSTLVPRSQLANYQFTKNAQGEYVPASSATPVAQPKVDQATVDYNAAMQSYQSQVNAYNYAKTMYDLYGNPAVLSMSVPVPPTKPTTTPSQTNFAPSVQVGQQPNLNQQLAGSGAGGNVGQGAVGIAPATTPVYSGATPTPSGGGVPGYTYNPVSNADISNQINQNMMANANANAIQGSSGSGSTVGGGTIGAGSGSSSAGASSGNFAVNYMNRGGRTTQQKALKIADRYANGPTKRN